MATDKRFNKTDHLIQSALVSLLTEKSFLKLTVNDICKQALIGRSTFYHHYLDKYDLIDKMIVEHTANFEELLIRRNQQINNNTFLIYLYQQLFDNRETFLRLLEIKTADQDFATNLKELLKQQGQHALNTLKTNLPNDFLTDLYATNALTAITWTLKNGYSEEIATFMNDSLKQIIQPH